MPPSAFLSWVQETTFAGVPLWSLLIAALAGVATYLGILLALSLLTGRARAWASQSHSGVARAMVDVLERMDEMLYYEYRAIMSMLKDAVDAMIAFQDAESGMFWQVIDKAGVEGNYLETSGSALFAYAVLKGVRLGYLPKRYAAYGEKAFYGTCDRHLGVGADGALQLGGICLVAGLGGATRRDGSLAYYFSEPIVENDAKGVGPLLLAYTEILAAQKQ